MERKTRSDVAADFVEPGRWGVEGLVTQQGFKAGVTRETDDYEVDLNATLFVLPYAYDWIVNSDGKGQPLQPTVSSSPADLA